LDRRRFFDTLFLLLRRAFERETLTLADLATLALADMAAEGDLGAQARRRLAVVRRFFEEDRRFFFDDALRFFRDLLRDTLTLALADLAVEGALGVAARRRRRARRFFEEALRRFLERERVVERRRREREREGDFTLAEDATDGVAVEAAVAVDATDFTEGARGTDALRLRVARRRWRRARLRDFDFFEADRRRRRLDLMRLRDLELLAAVEGAAAEEAAIDDAAAEGARGVAARRRRRDRDRDALRLRRFGCLIFFALGAGDAEAARFFAAALRSAR